MNKKNLILISSTITFFETFLYETIKKLSFDFNVIIFSNLENSKNKFLKYNVKIIHIPLRRNVSLFYDLISLTKLFYYSLKIKNFSIISVTPKGGMIGSVIKIFFFRTFRIHIFTGQVWANFKGTKKFFYKLIDKFIIYESDKILFDSTSQIQFMKLNNIDLKNAHLIGTGSIKGVNLNKFKFKIQMKKLMKKKYKLKENDLIIIFVGRINEDKGILDLISAFTKLKNLYPFLKLFIVGSKEIDIYEKISKLTYFHSSSIHLINNTEKIENYLSMADILCLPSKREGFGSILIEASAMGLPLVVSDIYGVKDCFINNYNGLRFKLGSITDLMIKLRILILDPRLREKLGKNGNYYVSKKFNQNRVLELLYFKLKTFIK